MSRLTGKEPKHWHDENGRHRMTDPRTIDTPPQYRNSDERDYVQHLEDHEGLGRNPQRSGEDSPLISSLFDLLEGREKEIAVTKELITLYRKVGR